MEKNYKFRLDRKRLERTQKCLSLEAMTPTPSKPFSEAITSLCFDGRSVTFNHCFALGDFNLCEASLSSGLLSVKADSLSRKASDRGITIVQAMGTVS